MNSDEFYFHDWIEENELEFCEDILKSEDFNTKDILVEKLPDGSDGDNLRPEYVDLNIWLKDAKGGGRFLLSFARSNNARCSFGLSDNVGEKPDCLRHRHGRD